MYRFETARGSLRARLILVPAGILLLGIATAVVVTLYGATARIESEVQSGVTLGSLLIEYALDNVATSSDPDAAVRQLETELRRVRHISVTYVRPHQSPAAEVPTSGERAPLWFQHWFAPPRQVATFPVIIGGRQHGTFVMSTKPADEVAEIWGALEFLTGLLAGISVAIIGLIWLTARYTLKPLRELEEGLDRLEHGRFDSLAEIRVAELRPIGEEFNRLARTLARTEADNRLLIDRLISLQESERKELARELHDEFGASLFGIRAAASCIVAACDGEVPAPQAADITERANAISTLADGIQRQNYRILDRIRPLILDQMGLADAVRQLVESWRAAQRGIACDLTLPATALSCSEEVSLTSYRLIQESLTNIARHARARSVRVSMGHQDEGGALPRLRLAIEDDGIGLPAGFKFGFGFLGMSERVRKLGGQLTVANRTGPGAIIVAVIPLVDTGREC